MEIQTKEDLLTDEVSQATVDKLFSKHSRVKAAASTSSKVKGLTLATREQYVTKLLDILYENYSKCQEDPVLDRKDVEDCSIDIEYEVFSANTNITMYRSGLAKTISNIKKLTDDEIVYEKLLIFEPKPEKHETLSDLFRNITKEQQLKKLESSTDNNNVLPTFKTARQAFEEVKAKHINPQKKINSFFKKASEVLEESEVRSEKSDTESVENMGSNKRDFRSLFGDESDEEQRTLAQSRHMEYSHSREEKHEKSPKEKHKYKSSSNDRKDDRKEHKHKKRSHSNDRKEDKKRIKEESPKENSKKKEKEYSELNIIQNYDFEETRKREEKLPLGTEVKRGARTPVGDWEVETDESDNEKLEETVKVEEGPKQELNNKRVSGEPDNDNYSEKYESEKTSEADLMLNKLKAKLEMVTKSTTNIKEELNNRLTRNDKEDILDRNVQHRESGNNLNRIPPKPTNQQPNQDNRKKPKLKKCEVGGLVVKLLTPAYAERRFESRDIFKSLARSISHALADKDENEIKQYVHRFLEKNEEITSRTTL